MKIIIPYDPPAARFRPELERSLLLCSVGENELIIIEKCPGMTNNVQDFYNKTDYAVRNFCQDEDIIFIGNSDIIFGPEWDRGIEDLIRNGEVDFISSANMMNEKTAGFREEDYQKGVLTIPFNNPDDFYRRVIHIQGDLLINIRINGGIPFIKGLHFVPIITTKKKYLELLAGQPFVKIGDVEFQKKAVEKYKCLISLKSWIFHYAGPSWRTP